MEDSHCTGGMILERHNIGARFHRGTSRPGGPHVGGYAGSPVVAYGLVLGCWLIAATQSKCGEPSGGFRTMRQGWL